MNPEAFPALPYSPALSRPNKPDPLDTDTSIGLLPQAQVSITHSNSRISGVLPTGESVEILLYGATIISWKDAQGNEKLFLSNSAKLDGSKAVRGGVPLVFPVFGSDKNHEATAKLPQHGFARVSRWEFLGKTTSEGESAEGTDRKTAGDSSVMLDFGLSSSNLSEEARAMWPYDFGCIYSVTLSKEGLSTSMVVRNEGNQPWEFQTLMHTYLRVHDISQISITGLEASTFTDKLTTPIPVTATSPDSALTITGKTDRVYTPSGEPSKPVIISEGGKQKFKIVRDNLHEIVVWNPWVEAPKAMGDFSPADGWKNMICVEAGSVRGWQKLEQGETWEGKQVMLSPIWRESLVRLA